MRAIDFHVHLPTPDWLDGSMAGYVEAAEAYFRSRVERQSLDELAASVATSGPLATRGAKQIMRLRTAAGFAPARKLSDALRRALEFSDDVDESIRAHREGRQPKFTGR